MLLFNTRVFGDDLAQNTLYEILVGNYGFYLPKHAIPEVNYYDIQGTIQDFV